MKHIKRSKNEAGFSMTELLVAILILIPAMGAAVSMFSIGTRQQSNEQGSLDVNQEARAGLEMMTREISQAGARREVTTTLTQPVNSSISVQQVNVGTTAGMIVGDFVDIDGGADWESVQITALTATSISGVFTLPHQNNRPVNLNPMPFASGVLPPPGLTPNSTINVQTLRFFGDIDDNGFIDYVEYAYDGASTITRSVTPINGAGRGPAYPFIRNVSPGTGQFTVTSNTLGAITSVGISMTVEKAMVENNQKQRTALASRALIPSAVSASALIIELQLYQDVNRLPQTPPQVVTLASGGSL